MIKILFLLFILTIFFGSIFYISYSSNKSRLLNGLWFLLTLIGLAIFIIELATLINNKIILGIVTIIFVVFFLILMIIYFLQGFLLLVNAFIVWRKESHSLANMLTLFLGIIVISYSFIFGIADQILPTKMYLFISDLAKLVILYLVASFVIFVTSAFLCLIYRPKKDKDYIIVLGAGLINGREVSPLLASRIDRAILFYQDQVDSGQKAPKIIFSGGQGSDEQTSEGQAMRAYAIKQGLPEADLIAEKESKTTLQNMLFSKKIIEQNNFNLDNGIYVSSDYHIYRAGTYARKAGLKIDGLGAKTSRFFIPNAIIREYIAILSNHIIFNLMMFLLMIIVSIINLLIE